MQVFATFSLAALAIASTTTGAPVAEERDAAANLSCLPASPPFYLDLLDPSDAYNSGAYVGQPLLTSTGSTSAGLRLKQSGDSKASFMFTSRVCNSTAIGAINHPGQYYADTFLKIKPTWNSEQCLSVQDPTADQSPVVLKPCSHVDDASQAGQFFRQVFKYQYIQPYNSDPKKSMTFTVQGDVYGTIRADVNSPACKETNGNCYYVKNV